MAACLLRPRKAMGAPLARGKGWGFPRDPHLQWEQEDGLSSRLRGLAKPPTWDGKSIRRTASGRMGGGAKNHFSGLAHAGSSGSLGGLPEKLGSWEGSFSFRAEKELRGSVAGWGHRGD